MGVAEDRAEEAQLRDLLNRLRAMESPADVPLPDGGKVPALPLADARFFAARRIWALGQLVEVLVALGEYVEASEAKRTLDHTRSVWNGLVRR
jgi:hypothetical protein